MVTEILLDQTVIKVTRYSDELDNGLHKINVEFKVSSDEYHDITTLLYKGTFEVKVPDQDLTFTGTIQQYSTSFTNLYKKGQIGDFTLSLVEVRK